MFTAQFSGARDSHSETIGQGPLHRRRRCAGVFIATLPWRLRRNGPNMNPLSLADAHRSNTLRLSSRGLTEVPIAEILPVAATLSTLDLSKNAIAAPLTLPSPLPRLVDLSLADNALDAATVQRAAPLPPTLRVLDLGANRITVLPPAVLRLNGLRVLKIDRQQLRSLPPQLALMAELVELDAGFNELNAALALDLPGLPRLRRLVLRPGRGQLGLRLVRRSTRLDGGLSLRHRPMIQGWCRSLTLEWR